MIIGHIPSGYIYGSLLARHFPELTRHSRLVIIAALVGAIAPDLDMLYFYIIDNRSTHHHLYWSHFPLVWLALFIGIYTVHYFINNKPLTYPALVFTGGGILHLLLDSIAGDIWWFAPIIYTPFSLLRIQAVFDPWWLNYLFHWSFILETLISMWAICLWRRDSKIPENNRQR